MITKQEAITHFRMQSFSYDVLLQTPAGISTATSTISSEASSLLSAVPQEASEVRF